MGRILLIGGDKIAGRELATLLKSSSPRLGLSIAADAEALSRFEAEQPPVVVLGPLLAPDTALRLAEVFTAAPHPCEVVMVAVDPTPDLMRRAMRAGARDVLSVEAPFAEVAGAVSLAFQAASRQADPGSGTAVQLAKVVTIFGTKGGVGKTVVATNLAVALARMGHRVVLLDLDLQFGDTAVMLQLVPDRTIFDAVQAFDRLDAAMLSGFLVEHSSGAKALLAPLRPEEAEAVTAARVSAIIAMLRELADYVVIDTPAALTEVVLGAIEQSDEVFAIATMDVPSVKNVKVSLQKLQQLGLDGGRTRLVLNRADSKVGLQPSEIETATGYGILAKVPSDRLVPRAVNKGVPVVIDEPRSGVARSLTSLAQIAALRGKEVESDVA